MDNEWSGCANVHTVYTCVYMYIDVLCIDLDIEVFCDI